MYSILKYCLTVLQRLEKSFVQCVKFYKKLKKTKDVSFIHSFKEAHSLVKLSSVMYEYIQIVATLFKRWWPKTIQRNVFTPGFKADLVNLAKYNHSSLNGLMYHQRHYLNVCRLYCKKLFPYCNDSQFIVF